MSEPFRTKPYADQPLLGKFILAAVHDQAGARELLAQNPELLDARSELGESALHDLVIENYIDAVRFLVSLGADVNTKDNFGTTPLRHAEQLVYVAMVEFLRSHNAISLQYGEPSDEWDKDPFAE